MDVEGSLRVAKLVAELGTIKGRKKLQKIVHLLQSSGPSGFDDFDQNFILYYYGPFSRRLAKQLDFLDRVEIIDVKPQGDTYSFSVTEEGRKQLDGYLGANLPKPDWLNFARLLNKKDPQFLEAVSTWVYLFNTKLSPDKREPEFKRAKPHLMDILTEAKDFAKEQGLLREPATN